VIFLKSPDDPSGMRAHIAVGANEKHFHGATIKIGEGSTGAVAITGKPWMGPYIREDLVLKASHLKWVDLRCTLVTPLAADDVILGTINLYHTEADGFTEDDLRVLNIIANQAAMAIMNAQIFERTRESAIRDPLTGLHNSRYLFTVLEQELNRAQRHGHPLSVLGMDMDNFKLINDNFGHQRGDAVLKDVAEIFKSQVRDYDLVIRYSGDEFIILLPETGAEEAANMAQRIVWAVADYAQTLPSSGLAPLGVSIGWATCPDDANDLKTLLAKADAAMYEHKRLRKQSSAAA
jgi:diguanylate cyclase (GGDEF)-like protein